MIIVDSSPIIALAKQGMLDLLKKCFGEVLIPKSIYKEIMRKKGSPEAVSLEKAIKFKWIFVEKVTVISNLNTKNIGQGEKEAISLAFKRKSVLLIDDDSAKKYASIFGIETHGTLFVFYIAVAKKLITAADATNVLKGMIADGFYISSELYSRFLELLESLK
jgi:predicted nucleic acid-binding protein